MGRTSFGQWKEVDCAPSQRHQEMKELLQLACQSARALSLQAIAAGEVCLHDAFLAQTSADCSNSGFHLRQQCHASF